MFSQNVFSARDVQVNSAALSDNNAWDSQQYSQAVYSSQNSQMSSMDMFSQQKGLISSKFDLYQRSESQKTEDEPPNYYSKYVSNPALFANKNNKNNKPNRSMQALIEEEKRNISMKEERDMLQMFINLLKDYTKEVDSTFKNFKNDFDTALQAIIKTMQDESQSIDDKVVKMKQELLLVLEAKDKDVHDKLELSKNISEQSCTIKILETKAAILEKQIDEMKNKESAYADQKTKFQELEQKYLQCIHQWNNATQVSCLGNTPPLSQHAEPSYGYQIPPLHHNDNAESQQLFPYKVPSSGIGHNPYQAKNRNDYHNIAENNPSLYNPLVYSNLPMNPMIIPALPVNVNPLPRKVDSNVAYSDINTLNCESNPPYCTTLALQAKNISTSYLEPQNSLDFSLESYSTPSSSAPLSTDCSKVRNTGSSAPTSCGLKISRRSSKKPKESPMALVKPQIRKPPPLLDDEIFLIDKVDSPETSMETVVDMVNENASLSKPVDSVKLTPHSGPVTRRMSLDGKKWCRQEDTIKRKRTSVSMLGVSSDDSEVQEITNLLREQSRHLAKRTKSMP